MPTPSPIRVAEKFIAAEREAATVEARSSPFLRYFRFVRERVEPSNMWMAEYQFSSHGRKSPMYLMPLDPGDTWSPVGKHTLIQEWDETDANQVPTNVRVRAIERLDESPLFEAT